MVVSETAYQLVALFSTNGQYCVFVWPTISCCWNKGPHAWSTCTDTLCMHECLEKLVLWDDDLQVLERCRHYKRWGFMQVSLLALDSVTSPEFECTPSSIFVTVICFSRWFQTAVLEEQSWKPHGKKQGFWIRIWKCSCIRPSVCCLLPELRWGKSRQWTSKWRLLLSGSRMMTSSDRMRITQSVNNNRIDCGRSGICKCHECQKLGTQITLRRKQKCKYSSSHNTDRAQHTAVSGQSPPGCCDTVASLYMMHSLN